MRAFSGLVVAGLVGPLFAASIASAQTAPPPSGSGQPPPPGYGQGPPPGYGQPPPPGYGGYQEPPPPPEKPKNSGFEMPGFAVRTDVLSALLGGRLGLELEVQLYKFITFEMVPEFIVWTRPPSMNLFGRGDNFTQHSNGIGALDGSSFGVAFWLEGKAFEGYFLKAVF